MSGRTLLAVPARAACLLVVLLHALRQTRVRHEAHVGLVDAHPERHRRHHHVDRIARSTTRLRSECAGRNGGAARLPLPHRANDGCLGRRRPRRRRRPRGSLSLGGGARLAAARPSRLDVVALPGGHACVVGRAGHARPPQVRGERLGAVARGHVDDARAAGECGEGDVGDLRE